VSFPAPRPGLVIRYSYLWAREADAGKEEGVKDRPCAIVLVVFEEGDRQRVRVLPVTHSPPADARDGLEIPLPTKTRLGLDSTRSWIMLTETNDFFWLGSDLGFSPAMGRRPRPMARSRQNCSKRCRSGCMPVITAG
jgi:hypothetical protein